jgi:hypothetical protein
VKVVVFLAKSCGYVKHENQQHYKISKETVFLFFFKELYNCCSSSMAIHSEPASTHQPTMKDL